MRYAGLFVTLLLIVSATAFAQRSQRDQMKQQTIQGCLTGSPDSYRLRARNGSEHMLIGDYKELSAHVGQYVQLGGKRDLNRDASASSDEATAHGLRFFEVWSVTEMQGECGK
jgi:hypothetical protein